MFIPFFAPDFDTKTLKVDYLSEHTPYSLNDLPYSIEEITDVEISCENKMTATDLAFLTDLKNLRSLTLWGNDTLLTNENLFVLQNLMELNSVTLYDCNITKKALHALGKIPNLSDLQLIDCKTPSYLDRKYQELWEKLLRLKIYGLTSDFPSPFQIDLYCLKKLRHLEITGTGVQCIRLRTMPFLSTMTVTEDSSSLRILDLEDIPIPYGVGIFPRVADDGKLVTPPIKLESLRIVNCHPKMITDIENYAEFLSELKNVELSFNQPPYLSSYEWLQECRQLQSVRIHLSGNISDEDLIELSSLKSLEWLELENCDEITDTDLYRLQGLPRLKLLKLNNCNKIIGQGLTDFVRNTPSLQYLYLSNCSNISTISVSGLERLEVKNCRAVRELHLADIRQTFEIDFSDFDALERIEMTRMSVNAPCWRDEYLKESRFDDVKFDNERPHEIETARMMISASYWASEYLKKLRFDNVKFNNGQFNIQDCCNLHTLHIVNAPNLVSIVISDCRAIENLRLESIDELRQLVVDDYSKSSPAIFSLIESLPKFNKLENLSLAYNDFVDDNVLKIVSRLPKLENIDLDGCFHFTDRGLADLRKCRTMKLLHLDHCTQITDDGLRCLEEMPELESLRLNGCSGLTTQTLARVGLLVNLKSFCLSDCQMMNTEAMVYLKDLKMAEHLDISHNSEIEDESFRNFEGMKQLKSLRISGCTKITDNGLVLLTGTKSLNELDCEGCVSITGQKIGQVIKGLPNLKKLILARCPSLEIFDIETAPDEDKHTRFERDRMMHDFCRYNDLEWLDLSDCPIKILRIVGFNKLRKLDLPRLETLNEMYLKEMNLVLTGEFDLSNCQSLTKFHVEKVRYSNLGILNHEHSLKLNLSNCQNLTSFHLSETDLIKAVSLFKCSSLVDLSIQPGNFRTLELPEYKYLKLILPVFECYSPEELVFPNYFSSSEFEEIQYRPKTPRYLMSLISLNFFDCHNITDKDIEFLQYSDSLTSLDLSGCYEITDEGLFHLRNLTKLDFLGLSGCTKITDQGFRHLGQLKQLETLMIEDCDYFSTDNSLAVLKMFPQLGTLAFGADFVSEPYQITDAGLYHLQELSRLKNLSISRCLITGEALSEFNWLPQLRSLWVRYCNGMTDAGFNNLMKADRLRMLFFFDCDFLTDEHIERLSVLQLEELTLGSCKNLTPACVSSLLKFPSLKRLHLPQDQLLRESRDDMFMIRKSILKHINDDDAIYNAVLNRINEFPRLRVLNNKIPYYLF